MVESKSIRLCGYRRVFRVERRLFRFDRWRIPYPHGVPLRGIGYFLALELSLFAISRLPILGSLVSVWSPAVAYLAIPALGAFLLMQARIDGRPPHHVLASLVRWALRPRWLAGLEPCPPEGEVVIPVDEMAVAFDGRESFLVRGTVRGPARIVFRYPAEVRVESSSVPRRSRAARARRFRVRRKSGAGPMRRGKVLSVPRGREVVIE